jgi:hypothetical protein
MLGDVEALTEEEHGAAVRAIEADHKPSLKRFQIAYQPVWPLALLDGGAGTAFFLSGAPLAKFLFG